MPSSELARVIEHLRGLAADAAKAAASWMNCEQPKSVAPLKRARR